MSVILRLLGIVPTFSPCCLPVLSGVACSGLFVVAVLPISLVRYYFDACDTNIFLFVGDGVFSGSTDAALR